MAARLVITEKSLRRAMGDQRYWNARNQERNDFVAWVTEGFRSLGESREGFGGTVFVRAYTRMVDGKAVQVQAHRRAAPPGGGDDAGDPKAGGTSFASPERVIDRGWPGRAVGGRAAARAPGRVIGRASPGNDSGEDGDDLLIPVARSNRDRVLSPEDRGPAMERIPRQSGADAASDVPGWARGNRPYANETPGNYSSRLMDEQYGAGNWENDDNRERQRERGQIGKAHRGYRPPPGFIRPGGFRGGRE